MGSRASTSDGTSAYAPALQAQNAYENAFLDHVYATDPYIYEPDPNKIRSAGRDYSEINALDSRDLERRLTPEISKTRGELSKQILSDLDLGGELGTGSDPNDITNVLQRNAVGAGLEGALTSGVGPGTNAGKDIILKTLGTAAINYRDKNQAKAAALLAANPEPTVGMNPGDLQELQLDTGANKANVRNAVQQQRLGFSGQRVTDNFNRLQNSMAMTAQQAQANASAKNQSRMAALSALTTLAGAGIGAGATMATGGGSTAGLMALRAARAGARSGAYLN